MPPEEAAGARPLWSPWRQLAFPSCPLSLGSPRGGGGRGGSGSSLVTPRWSSNVCETRSSQRLRQSGSWSRLRPPGSGSPCRSSCSFSLRAGGAPRAASHRGPSCFPRAEPPSRHAIRYRRGRSGDSRFSLGGKRRSVSREKPERLGRPCWAFISGERPSCHRRGLTGRGATPRGPRGAE